jgi:hypothetical protein
MRRRWTSGTGAAEIRPWKQGPVTLSPRAAVGQRSGLTGHRRGPILRPVVRPFGESQIIPCRPRDRARKTPMDVPLRAAAGARPVDATAPRDG